MFVSQAIPGPRQAIRPPIPAELRQRATPVVPASSRTLPLLSALAPLVPGGALRRGATTLVTGAVGSGATSLAVALLAHASHAGHWCAAVGVHDPGVVAMAELGLDLRRAVFVPQARGEWAEVAGELLDGVELLLVAPPGRVPLTAARRLAARARERRAALVVLAPIRAAWPTPAELLLGVESSSWQGAGFGDGRLTARRLEVLVTGRGALREHRASLWLPSSRGEITLVEGRG
jgi:hypothetical protein